MAGVVARIPRVWRRLRGGGLPWVLLGCWTAGVFVFLYVPIALLAVFSFNSSRLNVRWEGFTTRWYGELLANRQVIEAFQNSLIVAGVTTVLATLLGTAG
ncbi:MAG: hypothetical protein N2322_07245, partial [Terrimicrobiaceae bacterium]|nr:hypothetical protein [Terrimicrobiaceae bacterium]